jgi:prepilin-type N-terminal cleavage/methylation domain-containing protein
VKGLRKAYRGERGFTLVELLVVIVILGVLAAVATLAVTRFMGSGNLESAKTELHQAQTAIVACMAEAGASELDAAAADWDGSSGVIEATSGSVTYDAADSLLGATFKALYDVNIDGEIYNASLPTTGGWSGVAWDTDINGWVAS